MSETFYFTRLFELKERVKDTTTNMMASPLALRGGGLSVRPIYTFHIEFF